MRIALVIALLALANAAQAQPKVLPPEEFDNYNGLVEIVTAQDEAHLRWLCGPRMSFNLGYALACSFRTPQGCLVIMVPASIIGGYGWSPDTVYRHELGHCAGWGADHRGAR